MITFNHLLFDQSIVYFTKNDPDGECGIKFFSTLYPIFSNNIGKSLMYGLPIIGYLNEILVLPLSDTFLITSNSFLKCSNTGVNV